jgi:hypothetical protein
MKNKEFPDLINNTYKRKFRLGTRYMNELRQIFKYCKFDFGVVGKDPTTGKVYRHIEFGWIRTK